MSFNFDEAINEIQESINRDAQNTFSEEVLKRFHDPKYMGIMENPQGYAKIKGPCGDSMEFFLHIHDEKIISAQFMTDGCGTTVAAGSMACELAIGIKITDTRKINQDEILKNLGGLPEENVHCALLASDTLIDAANNYSASKEREWFNPLKKIQKMEGYKVQYNNSTFSRQRVLLDGKKFNHCQFKDCVIVLERGETDISGCSFENCQLLLTGNAYTVGKIIKLFTRKSPLKVLDIDEPLFEKT